MTFDVLLNVTEEGRWSASCPAIPGCETDGATAEEALDNLRESIALCLESRSGHPVSKEQIEVNV
jgi:predicted RNase H-like HicB family nuclease